MPARTRIEEGQVFGKLMVMREVLAHERVSESGTRREFILQCECGNVIQRPLKEYISGRYVSCGCHGKEARAKSVTTHGMSKSRPYKSWRHMKERCNNPKSAYFKDYGGRGITYPPEWNSFDAFWGDMGDGYRDGLEIDRIDPNESYSKNNCRWSNESVQGFNQRVRITNSTGRTGVYKCRGKEKWWAEIQKNGRTLWLGAFTRFEDACLARTEAELEIYGTTKA